MEVIFMNENEKKEKRKKIKDKIGWYFFCCIFLLGFVLLFIDLFLYTASEELKTVEQREITHSANVDIITYRLNKVYSVSFTRFGKLYSFTTDTIYISDDEENKVTFNLKTVKKYNKHLFWGEVNEVDELHSIKNIEKAIEKGAFRVEVTKETYDKLASAE